eukprot:scaffold266544_cov19-Prasinocladus_malaysianus.AAC.1
MAGENCAMDASMPQDQIKKAACHGQRLGLFLVASSISEAAQAEELKQAQMFLRAAVLVRKRVRRVLLLMNSMVFVFVLFTLPHLVITQYSYSS